MVKSSLVLPFAALALIAAKHPPKRAKNLPVVPSIEVVAPAPVAANPANRLILDLSTGGRVVIQLRPDIAPRSVLRVQTLAQQHFYDGLPFHRVIPGFMAQGGDPKRDGSGGSPLPDLKAEFNDLPHLRGTVSMARAEANDSANSQFYIMFSPKTSLNHRYTVIGRVVEGMAAVDAIAPGEPPEAPTTIARATLGGPVAIEAVVAPPAVALPATAPPATSPATPAGPSPAN